MKRILLYVRDYNLIGFRRQGYTEEEVHSKCKQAVTAGFSGWYLAFVMGFAVVSYKLGFRPVFDHSLPSFLMTGMLILAPYVLIMWQVTEKIMHIPLDDTTPHKRLAWIAWMIIITGALMIGIVPSVLQNVLPDLRAGH